MLDIMQQFIEKYYINPIIYDTGYNPINTITWFTIILISIFLALKLFSRIDVKIDDYFISAIAPYIVFGSILRVLEDTGTIQPPLNYLLISPIFYELILVITVLFIVFAKVFAPRLNIHDWRILFSGIGIVLTLFSIALLLSIQDIMHPGAFLMIFSFCGDIVPVSPLARMLDAFLITPGRIFVWMIFIGTAYQFVYQQYREERELKKLQKKLNNHIVICGYGMTGQAVVDELLNKKYDIEQLVVIDNNEEFIRYAADNNITAILGSASKENILKKAAIEKAQTIIITTGRDDTNVLIGLSAKNLNPDITIISRANEIENKKLVRQSGADHIITPSITGGRLMVLAIKNKLSAKLLDDLLTSRYGVDVNEREVTMEEIGKKPKDIQGIVVIEVTRGDTIYPASELDNITLEKRDWLVFIEKVI
ncbi:MAG: Calcium-gated potassium channel MthK [Candidatus Methanophagaceae archaeon]|nr:MAG: Calcium-gated potassium channel MthK [Methanophagales archaeon]